MIPKYMPSFNPYERKTLNSETRKIDKFKLSIYLSNFMLEQLDLHKKCDTYRDFRLTYLATINTEDMVHRYLPIIERFLKRVGKC